MEPWTVREVAEAVGGRLLCGNGDERITSVAIHSKEAEKGALFVPLIGEKTDAHDFIGGAFASGAAAALTSRKGEPNTGEGALIQVEDTFAALQALGASYRKGFTLPVIGITGSVGKTSTKEMIAAALETEKNVLRTAGNMNSQIGLPVMMTRIKREHEAAVIEMGMSEEGEMSRLASIAKPDLAVVTNIGVSHIGQLGSKENIRKEKLNIINEFGRNRVLLLNGDDELLTPLIQYQKLLKAQGLTEKEAPLLAEKTWEKLRDTRICTYGTGAGCDYRAERIRSRGEGMAFLYCWPGGQEEIELGVPGLHHVSNALAALAVAEYMGISAKTAGEGLRSYRPLAMRGQILKKGSMKIIDDTYNASPDSMKSGIDVLLSLEEPAYRVAVLADVLELGEASRRCHYEVGEYLARARNGRRQVDEVVTVGMEAKAIAEAVRKENAKIAAYQFTGNGEAIDYLKENKREGAAYLVKGSRGMRADEIVAALLKD